MKNSIYRGMKEGMDEYFFYLMFFKGRKDHSVKVGKSGNLKVRFRDLQYANDKDIVGIYVLRSEYKFVIDAIEYIFKYQLEPYVIKGEYFILNNMLFDHLEHILFLLNESQRPDAESWEDSSHPTFYSLTGIKPDSGYPYEYDWDEIFLHKNNYQFSRSNIDGEIEEILLSVSDIKREINSFLI